jgi:putative membrane protein
MTVAMMLPTTVPILQVFRGLSARRADRNVLLMLVVSAYLAVWLLFGIAAIVVGVIFMVRWLGGSGHGTAQHPPPVKTPLDILKERFARGEIDKEEFEERRRVLGE